MSSLHVGTFLLNELMHAGIAGLLWRRELNVYVEITFSIEDKKLGWVTCRLIDWGSKCHHHIWKLLSPVPLEAIHSLANMFSKVLFIRWIRAIDSGWKDIVRVSSIWRDCLRLWECSVSKFWPWSVRMLTKTSKRLIQCSGGAVAVISAVWSSNGTASYHLVNLARND